MFQVKFARKPLAEADPHRWLTAIVEEEAPKIHKLIPRGASRFFLLTNIPGTSHLDAGSIDKVNIILESTLGVPITCWWRDDVNRRLDNSWDLKWSFPEVLRSADILRAVLESGLNEHKERRMSSLKAFIRAQYALDEEVRFRQVELENKLLDLFIDVPLSFRDPQAEKKQYFVFRKIIAGNRTFADEEIEASFETSLQAYQDSAGRWHTAGEEQIGTATLLLSQPMQASMPHVVLEGAPGQGKSTLSQYLCQVHRMRLLNEVDAIAQINPEHAKSQIRLPIKVDLRDLAVWLGKRDPFNAADTLPANWFKTLEAFLAALISHQSGGTLFSVDDLLAISKISATLLVFDGLDEVADLTRRSDVVEEIVKGIQRLSENAASLQVIVTSRPAAFANSPGMPHRKFPHLQLVDLPKPLILMYADRWLRARKLDSQQTSEFRSILKEKLDQPHLKDLARNPMQLAILLSLIHTRGSSLPDKRTALYDDYINLFFSREASKSTVVRDHRELLIDIHRYLAWLLHSEAEQESSRASITQQRLSDIILAYLGKEGHDTSLAEKLFTGMLERVVAIVSRVEGTFEFEVQPLREYFAACHLYYTAPHSSPGKEMAGSKPDRFDAICRNFFWLNVTRFYAGCYSKGELPSLVDSLEVLTTEDLFKFLDMPRNLATTLLGDWVFTQMPRSVSKVIKTAISGDGLRYLLAQQSARSSRGSQGTLALPPRCGREELLEECFKRLESNPPRDFRDQLTDVIKANRENNPSVFERWMSRIVESKGKARLRWLDIGTELQLMDKLDVGVLAGLIQDLQNSNNEDILRILMRGNRTDYIEREESLFDRAVEAILERRISAQPQRRVESSLHILSHSLDLYRYAMAFTHRQPERLADFARMRNSTATLEWPNELTTSSETFASHRRCIDMGKVAEAESQRSSMEWATDLAPWDRVIEKGRSLWGERWALSTLANVSAGIRSNSETCGDTPNLLDSSESLARRFRYGRLRSSNIKWWVTQLASVKTQQEREMVLLVALSWTTTQTLLALEHPISEALDKITEVAWGKLALAVRQCQHLAYSRVGRVDFINLKTLPSSLGRRFACVLMDRIERKAARMFFARYLQDMPLDDPTVRRFALREAMDEERMGSTEWKPDLEVIRKCYELDGSVLYGPIYSRRVQPMSKRLAEKISASAAAYPSFLLAAAQEVLRSEVRGRVVPVADTASKDHWFENI